MAVACEAVDRGELEAQGSVAWWGSVVPFTGEGCRGLRDWPVGASLGFQLSSPVSGCGALLCVGGEARGRGGAVSSPKIGIHVKGEGFGRPWWLVRILSGEGRVRGQSQGCLFTFCNVGRAIHGERCPCLQLPSRSHDQRRQAIPLLARPDRHPHHVSIGCSHQCLDPRIEGPMM